MFETGPAALHKSFTRFTDLPIELRLKIWRHTLPGPRNLYMKYGKARGKFFCPYPPPICLHICTESRAEALKYYERAFGENPNLSETYFDFSQDGLMIGLTISGQISYDEVKDAIQYDLERVKFISCFTVTYVGQGPSLPLFEDVSPFKALEEITVLVRPAVEGGPDKTFVETSSIPLDSWCSPLALKSLELEKESILQTWAKLDMGNFTLPNIRIMSYVGGDYRRS
jgi:hypothetical protein